MSQSIIDAMEKVSADIDAVKASIDRLKADTLDLNSKVTPLIPTVSPMPPGQVTLPPKSRGIDVSHYQGLIDWAKVKAAGIAFTFIKASEGANIADSLFMRNWTEAKKASIPRGAYHFYRFAVAPLTQANFFVSQLGEDIGELWPVIDVEEDIKPVNAGTSIRVFCDRVFALIGRRCLIYTGAWWWTAARLGGAQAWVKDYPLWIAAWVQVPPIPSDWKSYTIWQYSSTGHVDGINGNVDLDVSV